MKGNVSNEAGEIDRESVCVCARERERERVCERESRQIRRRMEGLQEVLSHFVRTCLNCTGKNIPLET